MQDSFRGIETGEGYRGGAGRSRKVDVPEGWIFRTCNIDSWAGCFVVATEVKVRVNRPTVSSS